MNLLYEFAGHYSGRDRELGSSLAERLTSDRLGYAVDFKEDAARPDRRAVSFEVSLTLSELNFGRLLGVWHIWENTDPDLAVLADLAGKNLSSRLDLLGSNAERTRSLEAERSERKGRAAGVESDLRRVLAHHVPLSVFDFLRYEHGSGY